MNIELSSGSPTLLKITWPAMPKGYQELCFCGKMEMQQPQKSGRGDVISIPRPEQVLEGELTMNDHTTRPILCKCGCGQEVPLSRFPSHQPRFINGHQNGGGRSLSERFWEKVDKRGSDDCWEWTAYRNPRGYGYFHRNGHPVPAHRLSYELCNGPIPEGMFVCHKCDNPPCVNPNHLWLGTNADNTNDRNRKGRNPVGGHHHAAKLTESQVIEIRQRASSGEKQYELAREFKVARSLISLIVNRKLWAHIR